MQTAVLLGNVFIKGSGRQLAPGRQAHEAELQDQTQTFWGECEQWQKPADVGKPRILPPCLQTSLLQSSLVLAWIMSRTEKTSGWKIASASAKTNLRADVGPFSGAHELSFCFSFTNSVLTAKHQAVTGCHLSKLYGVDHVSTAGTTVAAVQP